MPVNTFQIPTRERNEFVEITGQVRAALKRSGVRDGLCVVYCPHTTAAITINENTDPNVRKDMIRELLKTIPMQDDYLHAEGNAAALRKT